MKRKPKFRVFRAKDAAELNEIMTMGETAERDLAAMARVGEAGAGDGAVAKVLFEDEAAGMSLSYLWLKANFLLPRHSHNADCLYYVVSGEAHLGTEVLRTGDGFFVPAEGLYAYQAGPDGIEVLEFRTAARCDTKLRTAPAHWARMADLAAANREAWRAQAVPIAVQRQLGAE